jgi:hypothetical protein
MPGLGNMSETIGHIEGAARQAVLAVSGLSDALSASRLAVSNVSGALEGVASELATVRSDVAGVKTSTEALLDFANTELRR